MNARRGDAHAAALASCALVRVPHECLDLIARACDAYEAADEREWSMLAAIANTMRAAAPPKGRTR